MCPHSNAQPRVCAMHHTALLALALLLLGSIAASGSNPVPGNVTETNLGEPDSELSIQLVDVPYFRGERMVFKATVRNSHPESRRLPEPQALFANVDKVPLGVRVDYHVGHSDGSRSFLDNVNTDMERCIARFKSKFQVYKPGESRSALFTSDPLGCQDRLMMEGKSPVDFGFVVSAHDILPDRSWRVTIHFFPEPIHGTVLEIPGKHTRRSFFVKEGLPGEFHVFGTGQWYLWEEEAYRDFSAARLNAGNFGCLFTFGLAPRADPQLTLSSSGEHLLVDGRYTGPASLPEQDTLPRGLVKSPGLY